MAGRRPRHVSKAVESIMQEAERAGWSFAQTNGGGFQGHCPCGKHLKMIPGKVREHGRSIANLRMQLRCN